MANGTIICTDTLAPFVCPFVTPSMAGITVRLNAIATDKVGNRATSAFVSITSR
jgi:hypothetical protein